MKCKQMTKRKLFNLCVDVESEPGAVWMLHEWFP